MQRSTALSQQEPRAQTGLLQVGALSWPGGSPSPGGFVGTCKFLAKTPVARVGRASGRSRWRAGGWHLPGGQGRFLGLAAQPGSGGGTRPPGDA